MKFILLVFIFLGLTIFLYSQNIESKYFNLICQEPCNLTELAQKLNVNYFLHLDGLTKTSNNLEDIIANSLDALYLEVCDILDIHIYSYKGKIKVFSNKEKM
ncbi:MAG: hypothetical protein QXZ20_01510, partial [Candidatus Aenigmatarchaeota archaeon]